MLSRNLSKVIMALLGSAFALLGALNLWISLIGDFSRGRTAVAIAGGSLLFIPYHSLLSSSRASFRISLAPSYCWHSQDQWRGSSSNTASLRQIHSSIRSAQSPWWSSSWHASDLVCGTIDQSLAPNNSFKPTPLRGGDCVLAVR